VSIPKGINEDGRVRNLIYRLNILQYTSDNMTAYKINKKPTTNRWDSWM